MSKFVCPSGGLVVRREGTRDLFALGSVFLAGDTECFLLEASVARALHAVEITLSVF